MKTLLTIAFSFLFILSVQLNGHAADRSPVASESYSIYGIVDGPWGIVDGPWGRDYKTIYRIKK